MAGIQGMSCAPGRDGRAVSPGRGSLPQSGCFLATCRGGPVGVLILIGWMLGRMRCWLGWTRKGGCREVVQRETGEAGPTAIGLDGAHQRERAPTANVGDGDPEGGEEPMANDLDGAYEGEGAPMAKGADGEEAPLANAGNGEKECLGAPEDNGSDGGEQPMENGAGEERGMRSPSRNGFVGRSGQECRPMGNGPEENVGAEMPLASGGGGEGGRVSRRDGPKGNGVEKRGSTRCAGLKGPLAKGNNGKNGREMWRAGRGGMLGRDHGTVLDERDKVRRTGTKSSVPGPWVTGLTAMR